MGQVTFSQVDDSLDNLIGDLIRGIGQHQHAQLGNEGHGHQHRQIEHVRQDFFQIVPPCPAGHAVGVFGGYRNLPGIVENLVEFLLVEVLPQVTGKACFAILLNRRYAKLQVGMIHRRIAPVGQVRPGGRRLPCHMAEALVQSGEEIASLALRDKLTEKPLVRRGRRGVAQLAGQLGHERQ